MAMGNIKIPIFFSALSQQTAPASTGGTLSQGPDILALITAIKATTMNTPNNRSSSTADEKQDKSKGVSSSEFNSTFQIYGKDSTGNMMDLPVWMQECATKVTIEHYK